MFCSRLDKQGGKAHFTKTVDLVHCNAKLKHSLITGVSLDRKGIYVKNH